MLIETMGQSEPHRRLNLDGAAYCLSLDLAGPFPLGKDEGFNKKSTAKYILVGTAAIPRLDREGAGEKEEPNPEHSEDKLNPEPSGEIPEGKPDAEPLGELQEEPRDEEDQPAEEEAAALNQSWNEKAKGALYHGWTWLDYSKLPWWKCWIPDIPRMWCQERDGSLPR